jgi:RNA polymerase sigma-70 factor (ECF subfamily)
MRRIAARDEKALDELYRRYSVPLYSILLRIVRVVEDAEDLLQEIFLQVWHKAQLYEERRGNLRVWLISLARNRAIDRLRSKAHRRDQQRARPEEVDLLLDIDVEANPLHRLLESEHRELVERGLAALTESQRQVIEMAYFEGWTQSEIAKILKRPIGTVKTQMRQGMIKLRDSLGRSTP